MTNIYHLTCHVGQEFGSSLVGGFWLQVLPGCRLGLHHLMAGGATSQMAPCMAFGWRPQFLSKWTSLRWAARVCKEEATVPFVADS